jgi:hypothetical protein
MVELIVVVQQGIRARFGSVLRRGDAAWQSSRASVRGAGNVRVDNGWFVQRSRLGRDNPRAYVRSHLMPGIRWAELFEDFHAADVVEFGEQLGRGWPGVVVRAGRPVEMDGVRGGSSPLPT